MKLAKQKLIASLVLVVLTCSCGTFVHALPIHLAWEQSTVLDFARYDVHHSTSPDFVPVPSNRMNPAPLPNTTVEFEDANPSPGDNYYKVLVYDSKGQSSISNTVAVINDLLGRVSISLNYNGSPTFTAVAGSLLNSIPNGDALKAHTIALSFRLTKNLYAMPSADTISFRLDNNTGNDLSTPRKAKLIDTSDTPAQFASGTYDAVTVDDLKDTLERHTDANGDVVVRILSGQTISPLSTLSKTKLIMEWKNSSGQKVAIASIPLNFVQAMSKRRFGLPAFKEGWRNDTGWEPVAYASTEPVRTVFTAPGQRAALRLYLKFKRNPSIPDTLYTDSMMGVSAPAAEGWEAVPGHVIKVRIGQIIIKTRTRDFQENATEFGNYVVFTDAAGVELPSGSDYPVITSNDGTAMVYLKSKTRVNVSTWIGLSAEDTTQFAQN